VEENSRRYPARPVLGVGALIFDQGRVLLIQRGQPPLAGYWSLPGGGVETGERLEDAIVREVKEETGLDVATDPIATVFERVMPDSEGTCEYHYVLIDFYCRILRGEPHAGSDSQSVGWFGINSLDNLLMTEGTREVIRACFEKSPSCLYVTRPVA
jgi:ADP-ribose pyrophosphatase YjhB (NUDIX family)